MVIRGEGGKLSIGLQNILGVHYSTVVSVKGSMRVLWEKVIGTNST